MRFSLPGPNNQTRGRQPFKALHQAGFFNIRDYMHCDNWAGARRVMVRSPLLAGPSLLNREQDLRAPYKHFSEDAVEPHPCLAGALLFHHKHVLLWPTSHVRPCSFSSERKTQNISSRRIQLYKVKSHSFDSWVWNSHFISSRKTGI